MDNIIPTQFTGKQLDAYKSVDFPSAAQAHALYREAQKKLFDINNWHRVTKSPSAVFCIVDPSNQVQERTVRKGDFIRIDIPGPGLPSARGYDWVRVEDIVEEETAELKRTALTLRPCPDPTQDQDDTAHFFQRIATSTILLEQKDRTVFLHYAGRNEIVNTENEALLDNVRNFLVGVGAKMGASFPQWKALIEGLGDSSHAPFSQNGEH